MNPEWFVHFDSPFPRWGPVDGLERCFSAADLMMVHDAHRACERGDYQEVGEIMTELERAT